jgi:predicted ATPase
MGDTQIMPAVLCPSLVGGKPELALLEGYLTDAAGGRGRLVFLSGEAGIGKSRLLREFVAIARDRGARVAMGRATQLGLTVPLRPFAEALLSTAQQAELAVPSLEHYR